MCIITIYHMTLFKVLQNIEQWFRKLKSKDVVEAKGSEEMHEDKDDFIEETPQPPLEPEPKEQSILTQEEVEKHFKEEDEIAKNSVKRG